MTATTRWWGLEALTVAFVFVAGTTMGARYLSEQRSNPFADFLAPAAMVACGHGFNAPGAATPAFLAFYTRQRPSVTCAEVLGELPPKLPGAFADNHRNLIYAIAGAIKSGSLTWSTLDRFVGALLGLSMALFYGLLRLWVGRGLAVLGVVLLVCSDHIFQLNNLRDYSKEPWFFAAWLALGWVLRRRGERASRALVLPACIGGAVVGIGIGFRVDLMTCLPAFPAVIAFSCAGWDRRALTAKAMAIGGCLLAFAITGAPTLLTLKEGSNSGHVAVMGLTNVFTAELGIEPPPYEFGNIYADGYTHALIAAHAVTVQHAPKETLLGSAAYDQQGYQFLVDNAMNFPADQLTRMLGATIQAIRYPFTETARHAYMGSPMLAHAQPFKTIVEWRESAFGWLDGYALYLAFLVVALIYVRDWRLGVTVLLLVLYFGGYSMIQYSRRHVFHLDAIPIGALLVVLQAVVAMAFVRLASIRAGAHASETAPWPLKQYLVRLVGLVALIGAGSAGLFGVRLWQQRHLTAELDRTLALDWERLATTQEAADLVRDGVPAATWAAIFQLHPDPWVRPLTLVRVPPAETPGSPASGTNPIRSEYLRVDVGGGACRAPVVSIGMKYTGPVANFDWEYTRTFDLPTDGSGATVLLAPALYWKDFSTFDGFVVPVEQADCIRGVSRLPSNGDAAFPFLAVVMPPNWRTMPLYQRLGR